MSLLRAAGSKLGKASRVGALAVPTSSLSGGPVANVRRFIGDPFDQYLARLGLVKKIMPNDKGSSLYRAVCESLSMDQREHAALQQFVEDQLLFQYHMQRIEDGLPRVNKIEDTLRTVAHLLSVDLHVYRGVGERPVIYKGSTDEGSSTKVMLCETSRGHFDLVITREDHTDLALAQTILYEALYIGVFGFSRDVIKESIDKVRADMDTVGVDVQTPIPEDMPEQSNEGFAFNDEGNDMPSLRAWRPPIPYSSVKALDPSVYRNLAYDLHLKSKKHSGDHQSALQCGSPCFVMEGESFYRAYVLSVPDKNSRLVLVNGIERRISVSKLLPMSTHTSPNQSLPYSSASNDTELSSEGCPQTIPQWTSTLPAPAPYAFTYNRTESFSFQYLCPMVPNGFATPSLNSDVGSFPYYYAPNLSSGECVSVISFGAPAYSDQYMTSCSYQYGDASGLPYSADVHYESTSVQNGAYSIT
ncbi:hypothetical protein GCK32_001006 [Trichostrongylus colubriformis]|uniref:Uncharacterized protein n=1 Tax=Trichostrongylus colubriformis TaxID=6319 RepID=A0AAN8FR31_TRICO